jgi:hypothetical protein
MTTIYKTRTVELVEVFYREAGPVDAPVVLVFKEALIELYASIPPELMPLSAKLPRAWL